MGKYINTRTEEAMLTPFKRCCIENFPFIEADFDALTNYELYCKVVEYLNKVINQVNINTADTQDFINKFNELKLYVDNYFKNLDIQDEVNNKLDQMVAEGLFDKYFSDIIDLLNKIYTENKIFLGVYFINDEFKSDKFVVSTDGIHFSQILSDVNISGRDPSILYYPINKTFYVTVTNHTEDFDCECYKSTDLINWEKTPIKLGLPYESHVWAPELFIDKNNDLYITISSGGDYDMKIYIAKCNNIDNLTFDSPQMLTTEEDSVIDSNIFYDKDIDKYVLTCKNNNTGLQKIYTSDNLSIWTKINDNVLNVGEDCEGGCLVKVENHYNFYGDAWKSFGYNILMQSNDLSSFENRINPNSLHNLRHGSIKYIDNIDAIKIIKSLDSYNTVTLINSTTSREFVIEGSINKLVVMPNFTYRILGDVTINNLLNPYKVELFKFHFSASKYNTLTINNVYNSENILINRKLTVSNGSYINDKLNFLSLVGDCKILYDNNKYDIPKEDVIIKSGWDVSIYSFYRKNNYIHIDLNVTKNSQDAEYAFCTLPSVAESPTHVITVSEAGSVVHLYPNKDIAIFGVEVGVGHFVSFDYFIK